MEFTASCLFDPVLERGRHRWSCVMFNPSLLYYDKLYIELSCCGQKLQPHFLSSHPQHHMLLESVNTSIPQRFITITVFTVYIKAPRCLVWSHSSFITQKNWTNNKIFLNSIFFPTKNEDMTSRYTGKGYAPDKAKVNPVLISPCSMSCSFNL